MTSNEVESYYHRDDLYQAYMDCLSRAMRRAVFLLDPCKQVDSLQEGFGGRSKICVEFLIAVRSH